MSKKIDETILTIAKKNKLKIDLKNDLDHDLRSLNIDSLAAMNLIMQVEEELGVTLPDEDLMNIKTLNDLILAFSKVFKQ